MACGPRRQRGVLRTVTSSIWVIGISRWFHTPGHSPGGIALWEASTGILFSGDIVYDGPLIEDTYHANAADYVRSMERLYDLPVRVVHGGHFPSYDGDRHRAIVRAWLDSKERA